MTREQVRKVARAIYQAERAPGDPDFERLAPVMKSQYEKLARVAIKAMPPPSARGEP